MGSELVNSSVEIRNNEKVFLIERVKGMLDKEPSHTLKYVMLNRLLTPTRSDDVLKFWLSDATALSCLCASSYEDTLAFFEQYRDEICDLMSDPKLYKNKEVLKFEEKKCLLRIAIEYKASEVIRELNAIGD